MKANPLAVWSMFRELKAGAGTLGPLAIAGSATEPTEALRRELTRGGDVTAVRAGDPAGAAALLYVLSGPPAAEDERALRRARKQDVPVVGVLVGREAPDALPPALADEVVRVADSATVPLDEVGRVVARLVGEESSELAARLPALRRGICDGLISSFSRKNGLVGAAVFVPGADLPVLTLNQVRLVLRIGAAHGIEIDRDRLPEILAVVGGGFALRTAAREALGAIPLAGWAVKGVLAYAGTKALGEAATRYFAAQARGAAARASGPTGPT
ncbi:MAG: hypothetical protein H0V40_09800 [Actinobacteria bacterium]|nr:hypothetical protein [Actinomycetota bacterium]